MMSGYNKDIFEDRTKDTNEKSIKRKVNDMAESKKINFEEKIKRLDEIVGSISNKTLSLNESLLLYEEGNKIIKELEKALKDAETNIKEVIEK